MTKWREAGNAKVKVPIATQPQQTSCTTPLHKRQSFTEKNHRNWKLHMHSAWYRDTNFTCCHGFLPSWQFFLRFSIKHIQTQIGPYQVVPKWHGAGQFYIWPCVNSCSWKRPAQVVTIRTPAWELQCRVLMMAPASSIIFRIVPPWTLPAMFASSGRIILQWERKDAISRISIQVLYHPHHPDSWRASQPEEQHSTANLFTSSASAARVPFPAREKCS